ncbi:DUF1232 domain-containing protein [Streptomyces sp. KL2]|uniref:DUF1232 domain-containing protein n=1 Tax=Streptomyces sp. KL2 TaxID=3050126 RepID=UPI00397E1274
METWQTVLIAAGAVLAAALLAVAAVLLVRLVRTYLLLRGVDVPVSARTAFWGALVYTVFPLDLLPDPVYLDDVGLLLLALHHLGAVARRYGRIPGEAETAPPKALKAPEARRRR